MIVGDRRAAHAGSWYSDSSKELNRQIDNWLNTAELLHGPARAIIAPHAGYQYCGACSAFAYRQISPICVKRVFILGPSHNVRLAGCALSTAAKYITPFYDLTIDSQVYSELESTGLFEKMDMDVDEAEHSIEMHLPYIAKVMADYKDSFTIVPVLVGSLSWEREVTYGRIFSHYLQDPQNLFVISSDFCHWGHRFRYTFYDNSAGEIHQSIGKLDKMITRILGMENSDLNNDVMSGSLLPGGPQGMDIIETLNPYSFTEYLKKLGNTICGRHPIGVLLQAAHRLLNNGEHRISLKFLKYAQSSQCRNMNDSSVSYASASLIFE